MKVLIWIGCFFTYAVIDGMLKASGVMLGAIPTIIFFSFTMWLARKLCNLWDEHRDAELYSYEDKKADENRFPNGYKCGKCGRKGPYQDACPGCGSTLKFRITDDDLKKCELCNKACETLTEIEIKDEYGTRYRKVCSECLAKKHGLTANPYLKTEETASKIMFCRKCGEKLIDDSEFCGKCGTKIVRGN